MRARTAPLALCAALLALALGPFPSLLAAAEIVLADAFPGVTFDRPLLAVQPPDGTSRMFVVEQGGRVWSVDHPAPAPPAVASKRLFLDLSSRVSRAGNEEGLLGFAFHPQYAANRRFLVHYSAAYTAPAQRRNVLSEMTAFANDPDRGDASGERIVLTVPQPFANHNGGWIAFGPYGKLFVALGDGGAAGDPEDRGQDPGSLLGKILRIDVDAAAGAYGVPADNPFAARAGWRPEVFAYGFRNPWRCSFDRTTGALWAGDVGQNSWEEIDLVTAGGNYGWRRREGLHAYTGSQHALADPAVDPVAEYPQSEGRSVTGGFVYRGAAVPALAGSYVFGDFETGRIWALEDPYGTPARTLLLDTTENVASFAEDRAGELYVVSFSGKVLRIRDGAPPPPAEELPATLSALGLFRDLRRARPAAGALRYRVIAPLWSDAAAKSRFLVLPPGGPHARNRTGRSRLADVRTVRAEQGATIRWRGGDALDVPVGTFAVKTFSRRGTRIETRVIRRTEDGFDAATYRWRPELDDADRVDDRTSAATGGGGWTFPSRDDCRSCHTDSAGFLLGVTARQLPAGTVGRWRRSGVLTGAPRPSVVERNRPPAGAGRTEARVRSYLDANCSFCHRPDDPANASLDLRARTRLEETGLLDALPQHGDLGIADARIVRPGDPLRSTLVARMATTGEGRMPQIATSVPDRRAVRLLERWIRRL